MRSIPFAFLDEETMQHINRTAAEARQREQVNGFTNLAETQLSMRGLITSPVDLTKLAAKVVAILERLMEMDGPNSIANLERAIQAQGERKQEAVTALSAPERQLASQHNQR